MSKINEQDYTDYLELINDGHSQRAACRILGLKRSTLQDYIKRKQKGMDCVEQEVVNGIIGNDYSNWITKEKPPIRFDVVDELKEQKTLSKKPRICYYDIETSLAKSYHFRNWKVNLSHKQGIQESHMLAHCWSWGSSGEIQGSVLSKEEMLNHDPERLVLEAWSILDNCDVLVAHNGKKFDVRKVNAYFLQFGLPPPSSYKVIDTLQIAKNKFALPFNSLEYLAKFLGVQQKIDTGGIDLWIRCDKGDEAALQEMLDYCKGDIETLRQVHQHLIGWDNNGVNMSLYDDTHDTLCPHCASDNIKSLEGKYTYTTARKYSLYRCQDCGATLRGNRAEGVSNKLIKVV